MTSFKDRVITVVKNIPVGSTLSYKQVAIKAGSPNAYRAVGSILSQNWDPNIPCHRVICSNGRFGKYNRGAASKKTLLLKENFFLVQPDKC